MTASSSRRFAPCARLTRDTGCDRRQSSEYTDHGHCGVVEDGQILNDPTLEIRAR